MSEQNSTEMTFQIQRIYTKDISFEAPNAPQVFQKDWQPEVKLDLDTASTQLAEGVYEVVLRVTVTAALGEETAGPSLNTCPRCASPVLLRTSIRFMS